MKRITPWRSPGKLLAELFGKQDGFLERSFGLVGFSLIAQAHAEQIEGGDQRLPFAGLAGISDRGAGELFGVRIPAFAVGHLSQEDAGVVGVEGIGDTFGEFDGFLELLFGGGDSLASEEQVAEVVQGADADRGQVGQGGEFERPLEIAGGLGRIAHGFVHNADVQYGTGKLHGVVAFLADGQALLAVTQSQIEIVLVVVSGSQVVHDQRRLAVRALSFSNFQGGLEALYGLAVVTEAVVDIAEIGISLGDQDFVAGGRSVGEGAFVVGNRLAHVAPVVEQNRDAVEGRYQVSLAVEGLIQGKGLVVEGERLLQMEEARFGKAQIVGAGGLSACIADGGGHRARGLVHGKHGGVIAAVEYLARQVAHRAHQVRCGQILVGGKELRARWLAGGEKKLAGQGGEFGIGRRILLGQSGA